MRKIPLSIRISPRRKYKLQLLAAEADKSITQLIEDLIDNLPEPKKPNIIEG
ncbi:MAG: hypothetical protein QNJ60_11510 [Xenococcaceae cyanobacterium MO_188.B19]|nr:hypothetical protein [Xenococcaceae cyanobacterium MO_188.B19]